MILAATSSIETLAVPRMRRPAARVDQAADDTLLPVEAVDGHADVARPLARDPGQLSVRWRERSLLRLTLELPPDVLPDAREPERRQLAEPGRLADVDTHRRPDVGSWEDVGAIGRMASPPPPRASISTVLVPVSTRSTEARIASDWPAVRSVVSGTSPSTSHRPGSISWPDDTLTGLAVDPAIVTWSGVAPASSASRPSTSTCHGTRSGCPSPGRARDRDLGSRRQRRRP